PVGAGGYVGSEVLLSGISEHRGYIDAEPGHSDEIRLDVVFVLSLPKYDPFLIQAPDFQDVRQFHRAYGEGDVCLGAERPIIWLSRRSAGGGRCPLAERVKSGATS